MTSLFPPRIALSLALAVGLVSSPAAAGEDCFVAAGRFYGIEPALLRAIAQVESSFYAGALHENPDGSEDIGMMQINSWWLGALAPFRIGRNDLLLNACTNIHVGAWILKQEIREHGYNWTAVGAYNAKSPEKAAAYARAVWEVYQHQAGRPAAPIVAAVPQPASDPVQPKFVRDQDEEE